MSKQPIEPKPTQYGNILFRSRLEARWAVFLDFTENVINWQYEPKTFKLPNGWTYTPDFRVKICGDDEHNLPAVETFYMEVKPKVITSQYRRILAKFSFQHSIQILMVQGDFYREASPIASHMYLGKQRTIVPLRFDAVFKNVSRGYYHAHHFRFDLEQ